VVYINRGISREELAALYKLADVAWVTPLRDGMNLVAKEYCACKPDGGGALLLSAFAGSAAEMGEAFLVNPYDEELVGETLSRILAMDPAEKTARMKALHERTRRKSVFNWADAFVSRLREIETAPPRAASSLWTSAERLISHYSRSRTRTLLLDYDGTLAPFTARPEDAKPSVRVLDALSALCADPANSVALLSGRTASQLERWFGHIDGLILGAEHGAVLRASRGEGWTQLRPPGRCEQGIQAVGVGALVRVWNDSTFFLVAACAGNAPEDLALVEGLPQLSKERIALLRADGRYRNPLVGNRRHYCGCHM
jgi:trehalose 6-phosphate synthase/phosphatase